MKSLWLLFKDELWYFCKSRVMMYLWVGIPLVQMTLYLLPLSTDESPVFIRVLMTMSVFGLIAGAMLCASVINELGRDVYVLLLVRPLRRLHILVAKHLVVLVSVGLAFIISILLCTTVDCILSDFQLSRVILMESLISLCFCFFLLSFTASLGVLLGVLVRSLNVGMLLFFFLSTNLNLAIMAYSTWIPKWFTVPPPPWLHALILVGSGLAVTIVIMSIAIAVLNRRQL
jgi:ABC-2 type transport system permease protein